MRTLSEIDRTWKSLTISNDFVFCKAMLDPDLCKEVVEAVLGIEVDHVEHVERHFEKGVTEGRLQGEAIGLRKGLEQGEAVELKKGLAQGEATGLRKGLAQGEASFAELAAKLVSLGRAEELGRAATDPAFKETLYSEFGIAQPAPRPREP